MKERLIREDGALFLHCRFSRFVINQTYFNV